jgi:K+:H+ antiporter subunit KhtU
VIAAAVGISSSAIVTKLVVELHRLDNRETPMILGIIVVEDVFLALFLALLQPILDRTAGALDAVLQFGRAAGFLLLLLLIARYGAAVVGRLVGSDDDELLTVLFVGLAILIAGVAAEMGVSEAIGAFMVGIILGETAPAPRIKHLVLPRRDAFGAVFFFAFGLTIDPADLGGVAGPVAVAVVLTLAVNLAAGALAARVYRFGRFEAVTAGLTLVGRGEFSLIVASFALASGLDERIGPFVAFYVLVLAVAGPLLASRSAWFGGRATPRRESLTRQA